VEIIPMVFKLGTLNHAKGFVLNKLYEQDRFGGKHVPVGLLSKGYPSHLKHLVSAAVQDLKKEGVIRIVKKRTFRDSTDHAMLVQAKLAKARPLLNGFRAAGKLPRLGRDLRTLLPVK
jgi:hypothetical protein